MHSFGDYKLKRIFINTENTNKKLTWVKKNYRNSLFSEVLRPEIAKTMSTTPITYFAQHFGFTMKSFKKVRSLRQNFKVLAYYKKWGKKIVSAVQHKYLPIVGVQFHPEKVLYEHKLRVHVNLTKASAMAAQELGRILFNNALENPNKFYD